MAGKVNALLVNFAVEIEGVSIQDIIGITGFSLGEEGTIDVHEDDRVTTISDGRRRVPPLTLQYRMIKGTTDAGGTHKYYTDWWEKREGDNRNVTVVWLERDRKTEILRWLYKDCEFTAFVGEDQDFSSPKIGLFNLTFQAYDVEHSIASAGQEYSG